MMRPMMDHLQQTDSSVDYAQRQARSKDPRAAALIEEKNREVIEACLPLLKLGSA